MRFEFEQRVAPVGAMRDGLGIIEGDGTVAVVLFYAAIGAIALGPTIIGAVVGRSFAKRTGRRVGVWTAGGAAAGTAALAIAVLRDT